MRKSKKGNCDIRTNKFSVSRMKEKKNYFDILLLLNPLYLCLNRICYKFNA